MSNLKEEENKHLYYKQISESEYNPFSIFNAYLKYLIRIINKCKYIGWKLFTNSPKKLKFNLFNLNIFLQQNKDIFDKMKHVINIIEIKNLIIKIYEDLKLNERYSNYNICIKNWVDELLKSPKIIKLLSDIEMENSDYIKNFHYFNHNLLILYEFINKIIDTEKLDNFYDNNYWIMLDIFNYPNRSYENKFKTEKKCIDIINTF